jgi:glycine cleavage system H protein
MTGENALAAYDIPEDLRYSIEDEWVRDEGDRAVVGVTDFAQEQLGDIVFLELPEVGTVVKKGETFGVIESVKAVSDLYAPISGEVVAVNGELEDHPEVVNEDCYGGGWIIAIGGANRADFDSLLDAKAYHQHVDERSE